MLRVALFLATNVAVMLVLSLVLRLLGVNPQSMQGIVIVASLIGFGGAFISLAMSKSMALRSTGAKIINEPSSTMERWVVESVRTHAQKAGIGMPDVAIYPAPEMNAFATGMNRNKALVAVSTGLLQQMRPDEADAVIAHEVAHIANGDMVTMALLQGVLNTFVVVLSRVIASVVDGMMRRDDSRGGPSFVYFIVATVMELVLGVLATIIAMWFSRRREFRADAGAANYAGPAAMIAALQRLQSNKPSSLPENVSAFGIASVQAGDLLRKLFLSHPPLEQRIAALRERS